MSTVLHEMAARIADEWSAAAQVDGEGNTHFVVDMSCIAADPAEGMP